MRKLYLECSVVWLLCGHEIECKGNIRGVCKYFVKWRSGSGAVRVRRTGCHLTGVGERRAA